MSANAICSEVLADLRLPIFLGRIARSRDGSPVLQLHTSDRRGAKVHARTVQAALAPLGVSLPCRPVRHHASRLRHARSYEMLARGFGEGTIVYDPTGIGRRVEALVDCGKRIRASIGTLVDGIYFDAGRRTLYVIANRPEVSGAAAFGAARADILRRVGAVVAGWRAELRPGLDIAVRIGFDLPANAQLASVDSHSRQKAPAASRKSKLGKATALVGSLFGAGFASTAMAADVPAPPPVETYPMTTREPAVAAPNLQLLGVGGWLDGGDFDDDYFAALGAKATMPLGERFGAQLDAAVGSDEYYGIGGHLFWRNPDAGLVGVFGSWETYDGTDMARGGVEAEAYLDRITIAGRAGYQDGEVDETLFGRMDIIFYATPNFSLSAGGEFGDDSTLGRARVEWQPAFASMPGLSVYADGEFGDDYARVMAGLNFHFGTDGASLIDRDRRYDPGFLLLNIRPMADDGYGGDGATQNGDGGQDTQ
jgi:hypothetical protein